jgi:sugar phosphate permease
MVNSAEGKEARVFSEASSGYSYRWVILGVLWITYIVVFLNRLSVGPLGPFFKEELKLTSAQVGWVLSAASLGYLLTQVPVGWVADRIGARLPIAIGELIAGGSMIALFFVPSYAYLLSLIFVTGMGCGFLAPSTTQAVVVWFPKKERATVMGVKQTAVNLGGIIGAATLPTIAIALGWRYGFLILGIVAIVIGLASFVLYREPPLPVATTKQQLSAKAEIVPLMEIVKNRQIWQVALSAFCLNWVEMAMISHFVIYANKALGFAVVAAGGLLAIVEIAGAVARPISGVVSDRMFGGRRKPVFIFFAVSAALACLMLGLFGANLSWGIYPVIFVLGVGGIGFGGVYLTLLSELGGRGGAAKAAGFGSSIGVGGSVLGPPVFGYIVDATGSYNTAWLVQAFMAALCVLLLNFVREEKRKI